MINLFRLTFAALLLLAGSSAQGAPAAAEFPPPVSCTILYSSNVAGETEPCG